MNEEKQKILEMLLKNAEEPSDIENGTGTFTTYRTEYLINDIADLIFDAKISAEMTESIKRYDQAREDGTLDKHFPTLSTGR